MDYTTQEKRDIFFTALDVRAGVAEPEAARQLMKYFIDVHDANQPLPPDLYLHFRDCFLEILAEEVSTEQALGLKRRKKPPADPQKRITIAATFLDRLLKGDLWDAACAYAAGLHHVSKSSVEKNWKNFRLEAVAAVSSARRKRGEIGWSEIEKDRLHNLLDEQNQLAQALIRTARNDCGEFP